MKTKAVIVALALGLTLATGAHAARSAVPLVEPARVALIAGGAKASDEAVKNAIIAGGAERGWTVVSSEPGKLRLKFNKHDKHEVVVDALYDATGYQLKYVDSKNMKYENGANGPMIHPFYNRWLEYLMGSIAKNQVKTAAQ